MSSAISVIIIGIVVAVWFYSYITTPRHPDFQIKYENKFGNTTIRGININRAFRDRNGNTLIEAYCHLRKGKRTFRVDRIHRTINLQTNMVINDIVEAFRANRAK